MSCLPSSISSPCVCVLGMSATSTGLDALLVTERLRYTQERERERETYERIGGERATTQCAQKKGIRAKCIGGSAVGKEDRSEEEARGGESWEQWIGRIDDKRRGQTKPSKQRLRDLWSSVYVEEEVGTMVYSSLMCMNMARIDGISTTSYQISLVQFVACRWTDSGILSSILSSMHRSLSHIWRTHCTQLG